MTSPASEPKESLNDAGTVAVRAIPAESGRSIIARQMTGHLITREGQRQARKSLGSLLHFAIRSAMIVAGGLLVQYLFGAYFPSEAPSAEVFSAVFQASLGVAALYGAYFIFLRSQTPMPIADVVDALDSAQRDLEQVTDEGKADLQRLRDRTTAARFGGTTPNKDLAKFEATHPNPRLRMAIANLDQAIWLRIAASIPLYWAIALATASLVMFAFNSLQTWGAVIVLISGVFKIGYQMMVFFSKV